MPGSLSLVCPGPSLPWSLQSWLIPSQVWVQFRFQSGLTNLLSQLDEAWVVVDVYFTAALCSSVCCLSEMLSGLCWIQGQSETVLLSRYLRFMMQLLAFFLNNKTEVVGWMSCYRRLRRRTRADVYQCKLPMAPVELVSMKCYSPLFALTSLFKLVNLEIDNKQAQKWNHKNLKPGFSGACACRFLTNAAVISIAPISSIHVWFNTYRHLNPQGYQSIKSQVDAVTRNWEQIGKLTVQ